MQIQTKRLKLRIISEEDSEQVHALLSLPETDRYNTAGIPKDKHATTELIRGWVLECEKGQLFPFLIEKNDGNAMCGLISMRMGKPNYKRGEVSYKIFPQDWSKGYATEALEALIDFGFDKLGLHRIEAGCAVENTGSIRVLEKAGMQREGRCRQLLPLSSGWSDNFEYAILETDRTEKKIRE